MKTIHHLVLSALVLSAGAAGIAHAQGEATLSAAQSALADGPRPNGDVRGRRDHSVTQEEFGTRRLDRLKAVDADGNGQLSKAELEDMAFKQMAERRAQRMTKRLDANGDGTVTLAEVEDRQAKRFAFLDRNGDGKLDHSELRRQNGPSGGHGPRGERAR